MKKRHLLTLEHAPRPGCPGRKLEVTLYPEGDDVMGGDARVSIVIGVEDDPRKLGYALSPVEADALADALRGAIPVVPLA